MLEVDGLRVAYGNVEVVHGVSFRVASGEIVALLGSNGAGKTTTLKAITGLVRARAGSVRFEGQALQGQPGHRIARLGVAMCPEGRQVFPEMTVRENLEMGAFTRRDTGDVRRDLDEMYRLFPILDERRWQAAGTLSGGQQAMLAIARALMSRPRLCLFDEPSLGLAPKVVDEVERILRAVYERGVTILLVEQNAAMALRLAHRAYVFEAGEVTLEGPAGELVDHPDVKRAYLGT
jgi:branched-chain amino acid transport system ATP-binding protein